MKILSDFQICISVPLTFKTSLQIDIEHTSIENVENLHLLSLFTYLFAKCDVTKIKHNKIKKQKRPHAIKQKIF